MRILILKDKKIENPHFVLDEVSEIYHKVGIEPEIDYEDMDYTNLGFEEYFTGYSGIDRTYLKKTVKNVYQRWAEEKDLIIFLVHEDNWEAGKVWGWNHSEIFEGYEVEQCRWDKDNPANTIGTIYHEIMHSHDSMIYRHTGVWVSSFPRIREWDLNVVHGNGAEWDYIRFKENQDALRYISPYLKSAFQKRKDMFDKKVSIYKNIISKLERIIELQRRLIVARRKENIPIYENNSCGCQAPQKT